MPSTLNAPLLIVDVGLIHMVDTSNAENLFSMWKVFSRCAGSLEEGRRLENLSWRLWNRETFCCDPVSDANSTTPAISVLSRTSEGRYSNSSTAPSLSNSLDSLADEEAVEFESDSTSSSASAPLEISRPAVYRQDSVHRRSRGRERHITPDDLEMMVITIKEKKDLEPLSTSTLEFPAPIDIPIIQPQQYAEVIVEAAPQVADISSSTHSQSSNDSAPSTSSERSSTSVVLGFSPSHISSSYRSIPLTTAPSSIPSADIAAAPPVKGPQPKKKQMFVLGGSSGEDSVSDTQSLEAAMEQPQQQVPKKKTAMFSFGGSSNEEESSLPSKMKVCNSKLAAVKKQTSFKEEVAARTIKEEQIQDSDVFETDDEDDVDESAIDDDDDSSEWEDSVEDSRNASIDEKTFFQRVDSRPNLTSRRSLITTMLHQNDRKNALTQAAMHSHSTPALQRSSRNTSPNGPSLAASPESDDTSHLMMKSVLKPISEIPRSVAQPIIQTTTNMILHQVALSPRTTRRNMLASELTVSLRQHLLWERKQKSQTANAVLKRRHTAHDVANLKQYPELPYMGKDSGDKATWNDYYGTGLGEYHSRGW